MSDSLWPNGLQHVPASLSFTISRSLRLALITQQNVSGFYPSCCLYLLCVPCFLFCFVLFFQFNFTYLVLSALVFVAVWGLSLAAVCKPLIVVASLIMEHGLQDAWASAVVAHRLSCPVTCRIFPDQGSNPCSLHWQVDLLPLGKVLYQGSPVVCSLLLQVFHCSLRSCNSTLLRIAAL